jgi:DNA-binding NarL/FixJ family response regulator
MQKRILLVDDNPLMRRLIRTFLEFRPDVEVCGEASDGLEGVEKGVELKPDVIVLDFYMPRVNGLQAAIMFHEVIPDTPIILFTVFKDETLDRLAHTAGVASVLCKTDELTALTDEIQRLTGQQLKN